MRGPAYLSLLIERKLIIFVVVRSDACFPRQTFSRQGVGGVIEELSAEGRGLGG